MTQHSHKVSLNPWTRRGLAVLVFCLLSSACSSEPEAGGPPVEVGAEGVAVTLAPEDLARLVSSLEKISGLISQMQQLAASAPTAEAPAALPSPPSGLPGPPSGLSALPSPGGLPTGQPEIPEELRNRMGLEVEALLNFLDDPNTSIPGKDHLSRIVDLTTSGTGQFSAQELNELEGEVQGVLSELGQGSGAAGLVVGGPGGPGPGGPGPGGPGPGPGRP